MQKSLVTKIPAGRKRTAALWVILLLAIVSRVEGGGAYNAHWTPGANRQDEDNVSIETNGPDTFQVKIDHHLQKHSMDRDNPFRFREGFQTEGRVRLYEVFGPSGLVYREEFVSGTCIGCREPNFDGGQPTVINRTILVEDVPYQPPPPPVTNYKCNDDKSGGNQPDCQSCSGTPAVGDAMAQYSVHSMLVSLNIQDTPLRYSPARGPAINFTVTYNQSESQQLPIFAYSNLGPKWTFNWLSYLIDDPATQLPTTSVYVPGGGVEIHRFESGTFLPDPQSHAILVRVNPDRYERIFPDGSKQIFSLSLGAAFPRKLFLTDVVDSANNTVSLTYDGSFRLKKITDALNRETLLSYEDADDPFKITKVADPFGVRFARFDYLNGHLHKITDEIGIESVFTYVAGIDSETDLMESLTTPYGTTGFARGESGTTRWIEITDPLLPIPGKERVEYRDTAPIAVSDQVAPNATGIVNSSLNVANTFFWDKKAMSVAPGDLDAAEIKHWLYNLDGTVSGILSSEKKVLENRVWYTYLGQPDDQHVGSSANPSQVARVLGDATTQLYQYEYDNDFGKTTKTTDPEDRVTTYEYDSNQIDLLEVRQRTGGINELLWTFDHYTLHRPGRKIDAAGQVTQYDYNNFGQILSRTNVAGNETTVYTYGDGMGSVPLGYLASIRSPQLPNGTAAVISYGYDDFRRVRTVTNEAEQYMVTTDYDNLDRKIKITYPDTTYEEFEYKQDFGQGLKVILDLTKSSDRQGYVTTRHYNRNRQMDSITDPDNRETQYEWCTCGSLTAIVDANHHRTTFLRDLQSRVYQKVFDDSTTTDYRYEGQSGPDTPGATSRLELSTDALNHRTRYAYWKDNNISQVSYTDASNHPLSPPTPSVNFTYDTNYNRIKTMTTGESEETIYGYYDIDPSPTINAGKLKSVNGPLGNDTIVYTYDSLGRVQTEAVNGVTEEVSYDALGRLGTTTNALGAFGRTYHGVTPRLHTVTYPNTQSATYLYDGGIYDRRLQSIQNLTDNGATNLSTFDYAHFPDGRIGNWNQLLGEKSSERWLVYDPAGQLSSVRNAGDLLDVTLSNSYAYDDAGNRISDAISNPQELSENGTSHQYVPNNLNQIQSILTTEGGAISPPVTLTYDLAGNLVDNGEGRTFEWDGANRLAAINYNGGSGRTEFAYDGLGRRVKITEFGAGVTATIQPQSSDYSSFSTLPFTVPAGDYTITFEGLINNNAYLMLIDSVTLDNAAVENGSFEAPEVSKSPGGFEYSPTHATWEFTGRAGIAFNGSDVTSNNPDAPDGRQAGFIQGDGRIFQTLSVSSGTYTLSFQAAQGGDNAGNQQVRVTLRPAGAAVSVKTFVWRGNRILEERDGTGATVTKRFFNEGEQRIGGSDAGNYYYSRDHLGSIREVTDSSGRVKTVYDYDPYGKRVVLTGTMTVDFGYTGHYFHAPSGLNLTRYRAYNPELGRWISRDPLKDAEMTEGPNLYEYAGNNPINVIDPDGRGGWWPSWVEIFWKTRELSKCEKVRAKYQDCMGKVNKCESCEVSPGATTEQQVEYIECFLGCQKQRAEQIRECLAGMNRELIEAECATISL
jgi:RHS repeat-associated protein